MYFRFIYKNENLIVFAHKKRKSEDKYLLNTIAKAVNWKIIFIANLYINNIRSFARYESYRSCLKKCP